MGGVQGESVSSAQGRATGDTLTNWLARLDPYWRRALLCAPLFLLVFFFVIMIMIKSISKERGSRGRRKLAVGIE